MTGRAQRLQIGEIEGQFRVSADRIDMIDFKSAARPASAAFEVVAAKRGEAECFPSSGGCYSLRIALKAAGAAHMFFFKIFTGIMVVVGVFIRIFTFVVGVYFLFYGVDLLVSGDPKPIPLISISTAGIEGRELPIGAFVAVLGVSLIAIAAFMRGRSTTAGHGGTLTMVNQRVPPGAIIR